LKALPIQLAPPRFSNAQRKELLMVAANGGKHAHLNDMSARHERTTRGTL
jgi:hypothetical protein